MRALRVIKYALPHNGVYVVRPRHTLMWTKGLVGMTACGVMSVVWRVCVCVCLCVFVVCHFFIIMKHFFFEDSLDSILVQGAR